ncbi:class F sortase [Streptomyces albidochromogenes]|uniref:sortase domain-containing protein n=1 Tax=Streptomyces albidochromogenes TaxID=329524 RepID=UPI00142ED967|nr:sortase [Streptomyces albidochromogenes]
MCTAAATTFTATALALLAFTALTAQPPPPDPPSDAGRSSQSATRYRSGPDAPALPRSEPYGIEIHKIGLTTRVEKVGTAAHGAIAMPTDADHAGWYTGSPTPGENGNTILVGHLDSSTGPAAFYGLGALRNGDRITLTRRDRTTATFTVTTMAVWPKNNFPSQRVYAPTPIPQLTLITCADWDDAADDYRSNLVITAHRR